MKLSLINVMKYSQSRHYFDPRVISADFKTTRCDLVKIPIRFNASDRLKVSDITTL